ncbi:MAG: hypothetical protein ACKO83_12860, partial [Roseiflexaceae bacterium]
MKHWVLGLCTIVAAVLLAGCSTAPILSNVALSARTLTPRGNEESVTLSYTVGQSASVTVVLVDANGTRYTIRDRIARQASSDAYQMRIDGTAPNNDPVWQQRALPSGDYVVSIFAETAAGELSSAQVPLTIKSADAPPPMIENLLSFPTTISPNADG